MSIEPESVERPYRIRITLNDAESDLVNAFARITGIPKAVLLREMLVEEAKLVLAGKADLSPTEMLGVEDMKAYRQSLMSKKKKKRAR